MTRCSDEYLVHSANVIAHIQILNLGLHREMAAVTLFRVRTKRYCEVGTSEILKYIVQQ